MWLIKVLYICMNNKKDDMIKDSNSDIILPWEKVNSPTHYNAYPMEVIDIMQRVFGKEQTAAFCLINAFKYRMRSGLKGDASVDFEKEKWYLNKHKELTKSLNQ